MENVGLIQSSINAFHLGGIWMWAILLAQAFSIAIIIERVYKLFFSRQADNSAVINVFESDIKAGRLDAVIDRARSMRNDTPIAKVVEAGARAAVEMGGREEIQAQMDEVLLREGSRLAVRTGLLAMLANVGTLLGLLGTIVGLIHSFSSVAGVDAVEKAALLTSGVAMAMYTTAYGLIMAIPALVAFGLLQSRTNKLSEDLNQAALKAFNWLSFKYESVPKRTVRQKQ